MPELDVRLADRGDDARARRICAAVVAAGGTAHYVGGSVRDALLRRDITDLDIEVFGLDPERIRHIVEDVASVSLVGASFGVLKVHGSPIDVSIPRRERKVGTGHRGFIIDADPDLSPEQAARRRDFTINAIAWNPQTREVIDPYNGRDDLERRVLRHTSEQFGEDPLRVLRGMQFIARLGLTPTAQTIALCRSIEPEGLPGERIFEEWSKLLLLGTHIGSGLAFLDATGWLSYVPELDALRGCEQDPQWHPEGDVWVHTGHVMDAFAEERVDDDWENLVVGLACLCHDLGKPATTTWDRDRWRSPGHEEAGIEPTRSLISRMTNHADLLPQVIPLVAHHLKPDQLFQASASPAAVRRLARRVGRLDRLIRVATADRKGRPPLEWDGFPAAVWLTAQATSLHVLDSPPVPLVLGRHLIELGLPPGRTFKPLLDAAYEAQLDGTITTVQSGIDFVSALLEQTGALNQHRDGTSR